MHILIVEDDDTIKCLLWDLLRSEGHTVDCLSDGQGLYKVLSGTKSIYDCVITDIFMPELTGDEAVILAKVFGSNIPVIYISGLRSQLTDELEFFLEKPFHREDVITTLEEATRKQQ